VLVRVFAVLASVCLCLLCMAVRHVSEAERDYREHHENREDDDSISDRRHRQLVHDVTAFFGSDKSGCENRHQNSGIDTVKE